MKLAAFLAALCLLPGILSAEEEEINLDAVTDAAPSQAVSAVPVLRGDDGLKFNLIADLTAMGMSVPVWLSNNASGNGVYSNVNQFTFGQYHYQIVLAARWKDKVTVQGDIAENFLEIEYRFSSDLGVKFGKIFVPFGEFETHHLYGGRVDENSVFLPKFWTDYGAAVDWSFMNIHRLDFFIGNGFSSSANLPTWRSQLMDNNLSKALGLRYRIEPFSWLSASASLYWDIYSAYDYYTDFLLLYGLDAKVKYLAWSLQAALLVAEVPSPTVGYRTHLLFDDTLVRYGWYAEAGWRTRPDLYLRLRAGSVDPDTATTNALAQSCVNIGAVYQLEPFEFLLEAGYNFQTWKPGPGLPADLMSSNPFLNEYPFVFAKVQVKI